eukprot:973967-Lingulodinium_polyedra.AAC.1
MQRFRVFWKECETVGVPRVWQLENQWDRRVAKAHSGLHSTRPGESFSCRAQGPRQKDVIEKERLAK